MLFDTLTQFDRLGRDLFPMDGLTGGAVDLRREGDRYVIDADLPGVDPGSVDLTVEGDTLTIRAERSDASTSEDANWVVRERSTAQFVRRFSLGDDIDPDGIRAGYRDGVLSVVVPLAEGARRHKVPVAAASGERKELSASADTDAETPSQGKAEAARSLAS